MGGENTKKVHTANFHICKKQCLEVDQTHLPSNYVFTVVLFHTQVIELSLMDLSTLTEDLFDVAEPTNKNFSAKTSWAFGPVPSSLSVPSPSLYQVQGPICCLELEEEAASSGP